MTGKVVRRTVSELGSALGEIAKFGDAPAASDGRTMLSYRDLGERIRGLTRCVEPEARVLVQAANSLEALTTFFGVVSGGAIPFLGDPTWEPGQVAEICSRYAIDRIMSDTPLPLGVEWTAARTMWLAHLRDAPAALPLDRDTEFVRFTSGSTGSPRALQFSGAAAIEAASTFSDAVGYSEASRVLCAATFNNGLCFNTSVLSVLRRGGCVHYYNGPLTAGALRQTMHRLQPDIFVAFPFVYEILMRNPDVVTGAAGRLRLAISSASKLPEAVRDRWRKCSGIGVGDYYGLAETGPVTFNNGSRAGQGQVLPGNAVRIVPDPQSKAGGRLAVRTRYMALGYVGEDVDEGDGLVGPDGYYLTKDLGALTADGDLVLTGRVGRVESVAGRKIDLSSVEAALLSIPGVTGAVVTVSDATARGEMIARVECGTLEAHEVRRKLCELVGANSTPSKITVHAALPRSAAGKIRQLMI